jgi:hypothetical protein
LPIGSLAYSLRLGQEEPDEARVSRPVLGGPGGAIPPGYSTCARHGAQRQDWRCQPVSESEPGSDLEVKVLWRP